MPAPRRTKPGSPPRKRKAPGLAPSVDRVDYQDVQLLHTFVSDRGKIRSRRITGHTPRQQQMVTRAAKNAREIALLPYTTTHRS